MCNLSALVLEKGIQEGIQQEKENSLYKIAKISREYGIPMEITLSKLKSDGGLGGRQDRADCL